MSFRWPRYEPWIYFFIFLGGDLLLLEGPQSGAAKTLILLLFFMLPLGTALLNAHKERTSEILSEEVFPELPPWVLIVLGAVAVSIRFWKLQTLFVWPTGDDASVGILILDLVRHWHWNFFYGAGQIPPVIYWAGDLVYQTSHSSLLSLWLPSAFFSAALVFAGYFAAKAFFSRSFSLVFAGLLAFSYWPLFSGRLFAVPSAILLWEVVVFYVLARFLRTGLEERNWGWASGLGLLTGLGFWISPNWIVNAGIVLLIAGWALIVRKQVGLLFVLILSFSAAGYPFLQAVWTGSFGKHIWKTAIWNNPGDILSKVDIFQSYWVVLFTHLNGPAGYVPPMGGVLNPLLTAFFFLGSIEMFGRIRGRWPLYFGLAFVLFMAEGFLSADVQVNRLFPILPLLVFLSALGLVSMVRSFAPFKALWVCVFLVLLSFGFDLYRLIEPYWKIDDQPQKLAQSAKSPERFQAYRILKNAESQWGPGLLFTDLGPDCEDESLTVATYPFNAALNDGLDPQKAKWAAIWTRTTYVPFLEKRFAEARWSFLPSGVPGQRSSFALLLVLADSPGWSEIKKWGDSHHFFVEQNIKTVADQNGATDFPLLENLADHYPQVSRDPFLQSCFLDKFVHLYMVEKTFHPEDHRNQYSNFSTIVETCLERSYPSASTYEKMGRIFFLSGSREKARVVWKKALALDPGSETLLMELNTVQAAQPSWVGKGEK